MLYVIVNISIHLQLIHKWRYFIQNVSYINALYWTVNEDTNFLVLLTLESVIKGHQEA
jgi:hypothetical protein